MRSPLSRSLSTATFNNFLFQPCYHRGIIFWHLAGHLHPILYNYCTLLIPFLYSTPTHIFKLTLSTDIFPTALKHAIVTSIHKKPSLDLTSLSNPRLFNLNLSYHFNNNCLNPFQSRFLPANLQIETVLHSGPPLQKNNPLLWPPRLCFFLILLPW